MRWRWQDHVSLDFESKRAVLCQIELLMEQGYTKFHITQNM
jgi:hypothetical protein